jgi:hypothetical protein
MNKPSKLEILFSQQIEALGLPRPRREVRFAAEHVGLGKGLRKRLESEGLRDWRLDFLFDDWLAVEINGGTYMGGRHTRGAALNSEYRKLNFANSLGLTVLVFDSKMVKSGEAVDQVKRLLEGRAIAA